MNYRTYMENHPEENLGSCIPYRSENGRVVLTMDRERLDMLMIDGAEIDPFGKNPDELDELWERIVRASIEDPEYLDIEISGRRPDDPYFWSGLALQVGLVECGCASCPWRETCDAMSEEIETPNELDDHPGSIFC